MPIRLKRSRRKGWRKPENAVIVDRTSMWGNPFSTKDEFEKSITDVIHGNEKHIDPAALARLKRILNNISALKGKDVICHCGPEDECHGDTLMSLANSQPVNIVSPRVSLVRIWTKEKLSVHASTAFKKTKARGMIATSLCNQLSVNIDDHFQYDYASEVTCKRCKEKIKHRISVLQDCSK